MCNLATLPSGQRIGVNPNADRDGVYRLGVSSYEEMSGARSGASGAGAPGGVVPPGVAPVAAVPPGVLPALRLRLHPFDTSGISNHGIGKLGEDIAAGYLQRIEGLEVIEHNIHSHVGEIDLIAQGEEEIVFVEVKTRRGRIRGAYSINPRKLHRMRRTAAIWLEQRKTYFPVRFAVIEIDLPRGAGYGSVHYIPEVERGAC